MKKEQKTEADSFSASYVNESLDEEISLDADFAYDDEDLFIEAETAKDVDDEIVIEEPVIVEDNEPLIIEEKVVQEKVIEKPVVIEKPKVVEKPKAVEPVEVKPAAKPIEKKEPIKVEILDFNKSNTSIDQKSKPTIEVLKTPKIEVLEKTQIDVIKNAEPKKLNLEMDPIKIIPKKEAVETVKPVEPTVESNPVPQLRSRINVENTEVMLRGLR